MEYPISHKRKCACINAWLLPIFILLLVSTIVNIYIEYFAYYCGLTFIKVKSDFIIFCLYQWFADRNIDPELTYRFPLQVQLPGSYRSIPADHKLFHVIPATGIRSLHSPEKRNGSSGLTARRSASVERCKMAVTRDWDFSCFFR